MSWLIYAFSGPVLWALSTHFDKYLVERYFKQGSVAALMIFTATAGLLVLPFVWFFQPSVLALDLRSAIVIAVSGILYMTAIYFYLRALQAEEASTVAPFFQAAGLFGIILGYFFLGEVLTVGQIIGALLIIAGSVFLLMRFAKGAVRVKTRLVVLMLSCAFAISLSSFIFKFFAVKDNFWTAVFWSYAGDTLFGIFLLAFAANRRHLAKMLRANPGAVLSINAANELINLGGSLGANYAYFFAPLGVVQAIGSTTPFFVLFFGIALSLFFPKIGREEIGFSSLSRKVVAIVLVVSGVILVNR